MSEQNLDRWVKQSAVVMVIYGRKTRKGKITKRSKSYDVNGLHFTIEDVLAASKDSDSLRKVTLRK